MIETFVDHSANEYTYLAWVSPFRRQNPREEPGALVAHAGICGGAGNGRPYRDHNYEVPRGLFLLIRSK